MRSCHALLSFLHLQNNVCNPSPVSYLWLAPCLSCQHFVASAMPPQSAFCEKCRFVEGSNLDVAMTRMLDRYLQSGKDTLGLHWLDALLHALFQALKVCLLHHLQHSCLCYSLT